jgi:hypothetical protein
LILISTWDSTNVGNIQSTREWEGGGAVFSKKKKGERMRETLMDSLMGEMILVGREGWNKRERETTNNVLEKYVRNRTTVESIEVIHVEYVTIRYICTVIYTYTVECMYWTEMGTYQFFLSPVIANQEIVRGVSSVTVI